VKAPDTGNGSFCGAYFIEMCLIERKWHNGGKSKAQGGTKSFCLVLAEEILHQGVDGTGFTVLMREKTTGGKGGKRRDKRKNRFLQQRGLGFSKSRGIKKKKEKDPGGEGAQVVKERKCSY